MRPEGAAPRFDDAAIVAARGPRNVLDPRRPYAFLAEREPAADGGTVAVSTIFLTNRECPFRCLMCDLWVNTTVDPVPAGAIPEQIDHALARLPPAEHLKLYNSGNFFDARAIPTGDHPAIASRARRFRRLIVENHPRLCTDACLRFREALGVDLEIALGLETIHPEVLPALNKRMTVGDFDRAVERLAGWEIATRAFVLLRPPFLGEEEGLDWAVRSVEHAFGAGVACVAVIPTRSGNGILDRLAAEGRFRPPRLRSLERALEAGLRLDAGLALADLWDAARLEACPTCAPARIQRLDRMNLSQRIEPAVACDTCGGEG
jgi:hypothetical protein